MIDHERIQALEEHIFDILAFFEEIDEEIEEYEEYEENEEKEETVDMCLAMRQIIAEENEKAVKEAILQNNIRWVIKGKIAVSEAAVECGISEEEFIQKINEYKSKNRMI